MKKKIIAIITIFLLSILIFCTINEVQALGIDNPESYISSHAGSDGNLINIGNIIVGIVKTIGTTISILILTIIGIKYIMGSVEEKAQYKQTIWPYIIGAILIFAGSQLTQMIYDIFNK